MDWLLFSLFRESIDLTNATEGRKAGLRVWSIPAWVWQQEVMARFAFRVRKQIEVKAGGQLTFFTWSGVKAMGWVSASTTPPWPQPHRHTWVS